MAASNTKISQFEVAYNKYVTNVLKATEEFNSMYNMHDIYRNLYCGTDTQTLEKKTNFDKVIEFNKTAGVEHIDTANPQVFNTHAKMVESCLSLIREEVSELETAVKNHNLTETRDALADILYVVYGMAFRMGINADSDFNLVHESNMSKFCDTEDDAQKTVTKYEKLYAEGKSPYPTPGYRYEKETNKWIVFEQSTGKILKNINYKPVDLSV